MVTRDTAWAPGTPCWVDLGVDDIAQAGRFYTRLFGWEVQAGGPETGGYAMCTRDGRAVSGIGPKQGPPGTPSVWTTYLASADADAAAARIKAASGQVLTGPMDVMGFGRMLIAADPGGAVFGVWQAGSHLGAGVANEPGTLCWNENFSRDLDGNKSFYQAVFGYEYADISSAGMRYFTFSVNGAVAGGIGEIGGDFPAAMPACWTVYFATGDTDAAVREVTAAGGGVDRPPWDSPYGRMAVVHDDQGAVFSLISMGPDSG
jgi:uncharacterized protein